MSGSHWGRGDKGKATKLHSQIVRSRGFCEHCDERDHTKLQCAHIISRRYASTRTDTANAFCLCAKCHMYFTGQPVEFARFVFAQIGVENYEVLLQKSQSKKRIDWTEEVDRLSRIWNRRLPSVTIPGPLPDFSGDVF